MSSALPYGSSSKLQVDRAQTQQTQRLPVEQSQVKPASTAEPTKALTDAILCSALRQGDTQALGVLYDRHAGLVYGISLKSLGNPQAAEDLTQDIFLTLARANTYDPKRGTLRTYLSILTRSRALDRLRSKGAANRLVNRWRRQHNPLAPSNTPLEQATQVETRSEQAHKVQTALAQLSSEEQQVLHMMYFEGLSQSAIAQTLSIPLGTVKTRSRRGLIRLRRILADSANTE
ncbi:MAG: sigma-70 family RNA polymerase sigma factor [Phormidesmis sp.]